MKINKKFNLVRARVMYAKFIGGMSMRKIAQYHDISNTSVGKILKVYQGYLLNGLIKDN